MTTHTIDVPAEPPTGTVVLDRDGYAWQRTNTADSEWQSHRTNPGRSVHQEPWRKPWGHLLTDLGPLVELGRAEHAEAAADGTWSFRPAATP